MKKISKKFILLPLIPMAVAISGCHSDNDDNQADVSGGDDLKLFGVDAMAGISPWIQSENDGWKVVEVSETQASLADINAVLINNNGESDTADIQVTGTGSHLFMLKSEAATDLSGYQTGYLEFKVRAKSDSPESMVVSIDNEWPNRSSLELSNPLIGSGEWETLSVPVTCLKPFDGATAVDFTQVGTPFHLDVKESFDFEVTDVTYRLTTDQETVVDADSCASTSDSNSDSDGDSNNDVELGVNNAPALNSGDAALYYSGDISQAQDYSSAYPLNSFGFVVTEENQVVNVSSSENGGVFLGNDDSDMDFSAYQDDLVSLDLKVKSYGETNGLQIRMDGVTEDFGLFFTVDNVIVPSDDEWYR
ncbi:putative glycoside hydrolase, partial [Vibrio sinaloensis]|uniref:putative glycoside hydrolase n=2 Tax=Vibrionaceae TaxID=641 RepID=UPI002F41A119